MARQGLTHAALAEKMGRKRPSVSQYLSGDHTPGLDLVDEFAKALGVSPSALLSQGLVDDRESQSGKAALEHSLVECARRVSAAAALVADGPTIEQLFDLIEPMVPKDEKERNEVAELVERLGELLEQKKTG